MHGENGLLDNSCDINGGTSEDVNEDGIPDECQCLCRQKTASGVVDEWKTYWLIISQWNLSGGNCPDVNNDGIVDVSDLLIVVGNWGRSASNVPPPAHLDLSNLLSSFCGYTCGV